MNDPNLSYRNTARCRLAACVNTALLRISKNSLPEGGPRRGGSETPNQVWVGGGADDVFDSAWKWKWLSLTKYPPKHHLPHSHLTRRCDIRWGQTFSVHERTPPLPKTNEFTLEIKKPVTERGGWRTRCMPYLSAMSILNVDGQKYTLGLRPFLRRELFAAFLLSKFNLMHDHYLWQIVFHK